MKRIFTAFFLILHIIGFSQVALIQDSDGYSNVRAKSNGESDILFKIYNNYVFWYDIEEYENQTEWISVMVPKNIYSLGFTDPQVIWGFLHRSRIKPLSELNAYTGTDLKFNYVLCDFDPSKKIFDYDKENGKWITAINGRPVWGADGYKPKIEVKDIELRIENKPIQIDKVFFSDIFECKNEFSVYKKDNLYFIYQRNSDGAGSYEIVWVLSNEGVIQRLVGNMI